MAFASYGLLPGDWWWTSCVAACDGGCSGGFAVGRRAAAGHVAPEAQEFAVELDVRFGELPDRFVHLGCAPSQNHDPPEKQDHHDAEYGAECDHENGGAHSHPLFRGCTRVTCCSLWGNNHSAPHSFNCHAYMRSPLHNRDNHRTSARAGLTPTFRRRIQVAAHLVEQLAERVQPLVHGQLPESPDGVLDIGVHVRG